MFKRHSSIYSFLVLTLFLFGVTWVITKPQIIDDPKIEHIKVFCWNLTTNQASFYATVCIAIFAGAGFLVSIATWIRKIEDNCKERANQQIQAWNTNEIKECVVHLDQTWEAIASVILDQGKSFDEKSEYSYSHIHGNAEMFSSIKHALNILEDICLSAHTGFADQDVIDSSMAGVIVTYYFRFKWFIFKARKVIHQPKLYIEIETYAERLLNQGWNPSEVNE